MPVPFADLHAQYATIKPEVDAAIADVIANSAFIRGPHVTQFEEDFAKAIGAKYCVSCANGTDAIYIAMIAMGVGPGDEVVVPAMSWISTSETVSQTGAKVVFCDVDPMTYTMDPTLLEACITDKTVGIIPVHLYGQPTDMTSIMTIANGHNLWVLEDSAQAHLARFDNKQIGSFGRVATFSFYPGKNLGAMGDAGGIVTNDKALADQMAKFARHGGLKKGDHEIEGINSRMDGLQAAILGVKLPHLAGWTKRRQELAAVYTSKLADLEWLKLPSTDPRAEPVWHLYVVQCEDRDKLRAHLTERGVATAINYPCALPFLPCYINRGHTKADFPVAHRLGTHGVSLPLFAEMTEAQINEVIEAVKSFK